MIRIIVKYDFYHVFYFMPAITLFRSVKGIRQRRGATRAITGRREVIAQSEPV